MCPSNRTWLEVDENFKQYYVNQWFRVQAQMIFTSIPKETPTFESIEQRVTTRN